MTDKYIRLYNVSLKLSIVATAMFTGTLAVLLSDIIVSYSLVGTEQGLLSSTLSIGALLAVLMTVILQGKFKKTQYIIVCGFLASVMLILMGISMPFVLFLAAIFVMGFGYGAVDAGQSAFIADLNQGNIARHMGALHGIFGLCGILTPIILHWLLNYLDWRTIYIVVGVVSLVVIAQFAFVTQVLKSRVSVAERKEQKLTVSGLKEFFGNKYLTLLLFCMFWGTAAQSGIIVWTIRYVSVFLKSPDIAAVCLSVFWITSTMSRFLAPLLPFKPNQILTYGALVCAIVWTIAIAVDTPLVICISCGITGLANGPCIPMSLSEGTLINTDKTGLTTNVLMVFKTIAQILSPIVLAFMMSFTTMQNSMFVTSIFFVMNGVFGILMIRNKKRCSGINSKESSKNCIEEC